MEFTENLVSLRDLSLFDYLQLIIGTNKNKNILVYKDKQMGVLIIENREVIFAIDYLGNKGNKAFYNICSWQNSSFREIDIKEEVQANVKFKGNILLKAAEYIDKSQNLDDAIPLLDEIEFSCKYPEIQRLFIKNKIEYRNIHNEDKLVKSIINELIVDYSIETLAIVKRQNNENTIIALHNCELIDFVDLFSEIFDAIDKTIKNKKFNIKVNQYQLSLENNKMMIAERIEDTNYLIALQIDNKEILTGIILNVFIPLLKEELQKILSY